MARRQPPALVAPSDLIAFSDEHLRYEVVMFFLAIQNRRHVIRTGDRNRDVFIRNARVEAFANHLRALVMFLYPEAYPRTGDDVTAPDFLAEPRPHARWIGLRGGLPDVLRVAKERADKEVSHLTARRKPEGDPDKPWNYVELGEVLRRILRVFVASADPKRLGPRVGENIPNGPL